jgi:hypothetical protein
MGKREKNEKKPNLDSFQNNLNDPHPPKGALVGAG